MQRPLFSLPGLAVLSNVQIICLLRRYALSGGKGSGKLDKAAHWPTWQDAAKRFKCSPINGKNKNLSNCLKSKQYIQGAVAGQKYTLLCRA
jgi:hypothetical protein